MRTVCLVLVFVFFGVQAAFATGEIGLVDSSGLEYFVNTNITSTSFSSSSASGAVSEASYTSSVPGVTTSGGGTTTSTLTDAFDGYNSLWVEVDGNGWVGYYDNGVASVGDSGRTVVLNEQTVEDVAIYRKVFVPDNDQFCRWLNVFTNNGASTKTIQVEIGNNLGSDSETLIHSTSNGNKRAQISDSWVVSYEDYDVSGFSTDPRLGHVLQGVDAAGIGCSKEGRVPVPLSGIFFEDGDGEPYWNYEFELAPGETVILMNFVTGQRSLADAAAQAEALANLEGSALDFLTPDEESQIVNFNVNAAKGFFSFGSITPIGIVPVGRAGGDLVLVAALLVMLVGVRKAMVRAQ